MRRRPRECARRNKWQLTTLYCAQPSWDRSAITPLTPFDLAAPILGERGATAAAAELRTALETVGIDDRARAVVASPPAAHAIIQTEREIGAELLVIGTHRRSLIRRVLLGSTSASVVRKAGCSVLVVPLSSG